MGLFCCVFPTNLGAQSSYKAEREQENAILDVVACFDSGMFSEAQKRASAILETDPDNDAAHYYMGLTCFAKGDYDAAEIEMQNAVRLDSGNFWYRYRLAGIYGATDRPELAAEMYEELLKDFPDKSDLYYTLIDAYLTAGKMEEVLQTLNQIETVQGKSEVVTMTKFNVLCQLDRQEEAYADLEEYNKEYSSPEVLAVLGDYSMSMYNDSLAIAYYDEALDLMPSYGPAILGKAETYRITRRYDEYFEQLNNLVLDSEINSEGKCDYLTAVVQRMDPNFLRNFRPQFDQVIGNCVATHPKDSSVNYLAGIYYYGSDRKDQAKDYFRENAETWPDNVGFAADYSEMLAYMQEWKELSTYSKEAYERFPDTYDFLELSIYADYNLKDFDTVVLTCNRLISTCPDTTTVLSSYSTIGDVLYKRGETAAAYKAYESALEINPNYIPVLNNYAYYLSLEGKKLKKAASMSKITVEDQPDNPTYLDTYGWILYLQGKAAEAKPYFKHAMLYGGKDSAVILDHYAEVLYALGEYDLAFVYWNQALQKDTEGAIEGLQAKIKAKRAAIK